MAPMRILHIHLDIRQRSKQVPELYSELQFPYSLQLHPLNRIYSRLAGSFGLHQEKVARRLKAFSLQRYPTSSVRFWLGITLQLKGSFYTGHFVVGSLQVGRNVQTTDLRSSSQSSNPVEPPLSLDFPGQEWLLSHLIPISVSHDKTIRRRQVQIRQHSRQGRRIRRPRRKLCTYRQTSAGGISRGTGDSEEYNRTRKGRDAFQANIGLILPGRQNCGCHWRSSRIGLGYGPSVGEQRC